MSNQQITNKEKRKLRKARLQAVARRGDRPQLTVRQARNVAERIETIRRAHAMTMPTIERAPVFVEILNRAALFAHDNGMVFWRKIRQCEELECACCGLDNIPTAKVTAFAFARRSPVWDSDLWALAVCQNCFGHADLAKLVRAHVQWLLDHKIDSGHYRVVDVRLSRAKR